MSSQQRERGTGQSPRGGRLRRVWRRLRGGELTPGRKSVIWDGRADNGAQVSSGVYFYRLTTGEKVAQRKMTLLK